MRRRDSEARASVQSGQLDQSLSLSPEILEPVRRQSCIDRRARDRAKPQPSPNCPGIVPLVGERIAAGVAKHVRVRLQFEAGAEGRAFDHPGKVRGRERRAALADEDEGRRLTLALPGQARHCALWAPGVRPARHRIEGLN